MRKYWSKEGPQHSKENTNSSEQCISTNSPSTVSLISKSLNRHTPLALLVVTHFNISWSLFTPSVPLSLADNSRNWVLQNLGVPNEIQTSDHNFTQWPINVYIEGLLLTFLASVVFCICWRRPQALYSCILLSSKGTPTWLGIPRSTACLGCSLATSWIILL